MLKSIAIVTIVVQQLGAIESAYQESFNYQTVQSGVVSAELAEVWSAPASRDRAYLLMQPSSGAEVYLRFIEGDEAKGYGPMQTFGWNATELLVKDPDRLAAELAESEFDIVGEPKDLWAAPNAPRAMQVIGPGNELVYLTRNQNFATNADVDRVFIMVVGGPSMTELNHFYSEKMGLQVGDATPFEIHVISAALNLPEDTAYPLAIATVSPDFLIELDEYPAAARPRPVHPDALPPGIAMVSFTADNLDEFEVAWRATPRRIESAPYNGNLAGVTTGSAGEWIEIIEVATEDD